MKNWKPLPLSLKILSLLLTIWAVMSILVLITMPEREIAFFGLTLKGFPSVIVVALLDFISPLIFLYALWKRLKWGANFGMLYNGVFILNNAIALFTHFEVFGNAIYFPLIVSIIFFSIILKERNYFS